MQFAEDLGIFFQNAADCGLGTELSTLSFPFLAHHLSAWTDINLHLFRSEMPERHTRIVKGNCKPRNYA